MRRPSRSIRLAVTALLAIVAAALIVAVVAQVRDQPSATDPPAFGAQPRAGDEPDTLDNLTELLPDRCATDDEPADLAPPSGALRLSGARESDGALVEHTAVWQVQGGDVPDVVEHYEAQAAARGYESTRNLVHDDPNINHRVYVRAGRMLTIRVRRAGETLRVVIQLRYTNARPAQAPEASRP